MKLSEDPELREEMEKEVGSTTETSGRKEKSGTPETSSSVEDIVKKLNLNTETGKSPAPAVTQRSESISEGWADDGDNDDWGDFNEKTEDGES